MRAKRCHIVQLSLRTHLHSPARIRTGVPIRPRLTNARPVDRPDEKEADGIVGAGAGPRAACRITGAPVCCARSLRS